MKIIPPLAAFAAGYAGGKLARTRRVKRAVHALRGRPLAYRLTYEKGSLVIREPYTVIEDCQFVGTETVYIALHEERYPLAVFRSREEAERWIIEQPQADYTFSVEEESVRSAPAIRLVA